MFLSKQPTENALPKQGIEDKKMVIDIEIYTHVSYDFNLIIEKKSEANSYGDENYVLTATGTASVEKIPEKDQQIMLLNKLKMQKQKIRADAEVALEKIDERIQSLLAISHKESQQ